MSFLLSVTSDGFVATKPTLHEPQFRNNPFLSPAWASSVITYV